MVVAGDGIVEGVHADVQDTEIRIFVLEKDLVHRTWFIGCREILRSYEMLFVQISLSDTEKVEHYNENHSNTDGCHLESRLGIGQ